MNISCIISSSACSLIILFNRVAKSLVKLKLLGGICTRTQKKGCAPGTSFLPRKNLFPFSFLIRHLRKYRLSTLLFTRFTKRSRTMALRILPKHAVRMCHVQAVITSTNLPLFCCLIMTLEHSTPITTHTKTHTYSHTPGVSYSVPEMYHCKGVCGRRSSCSSLTHLRMPSFPFITPAAAPKLGALFFLSLFSFPSMTARQLRCLRGQKTPPPHFFVSSHCNINLSDFFNAPLTRTSKTVDFSPFVPINIFLSCSPSCRFYLPLNGRKCDPEMQKKKKPHSLVKVREEVDKHEVLFVAPLIKV